MEAIVVLRRRTLSSTELRPRCALFPASISQPGRETPLDGLGRTGGSILAKQAELMKFFDLARRKMQRATGACGAAAAPAGMQGYSLLAWQRGVGLFTGNWREGMAMRRLGCWSMRPATQSQRGSAAGGSRRLCTVGAAEDRACRARAGQGMQRTGAGVAALRPRHAVE